MGRRWTDCIMNCVFHALQNKSSACCCYLLARELIAVLLRQKLPAVIAFVYRISVVVILLASVTDFLNTSTAYKSLYCFKKLSLFKKQKKNIKLESSI